VTSGVLIEAVAALRPIVATRFPHAVELLGDGTGLLVPHGDAPAIAAAIRSIITDDSLISELARAAAARAPDLLWPSVAHRYQRLATGLVARTRSRMSQTRSAPTRPAAVAR
jgi:glycosyltransferase involved in cell wall biosynthesis